MKRSYLIKPVLDEQLPEIAFGRGVYLYGADGKEYLDGSSGAITCNIGHGVKEITDAMNEQAKKVSFVYRSHFTSKSAEMLADMLAEQLPGDLNWSFFVNSGSEAAETAMKMAIQYWQEKGRPSKTAVLSRWRSYHGITMGALSLSGYPERRVRFTGHLASSPDVCAPYCFRCPLQQSYPSCQLMCADDLERSIKRMGEENIAAFMAEPIVGAAGACLTPPPGYYERIREICDRYDVLFIADEVMTGMGRTGKILAIEHWDCMPDIAVLGKGLGAGYSPIAAAVASDKVMKSFRDGTRVIMSGHTYSGNPQSAAAALAVLHYLKKHSLAAHAAKQGQDLMEKLKEMQKSNPFIGDVRGRGLLIGMELVNQNHAPFPKQRRAGAKFIELAFKNGLILYPASAGIDGGDGDAVIIAPPLTITSQETADLLKRFKRTCSQFMQWQEEG
ncbi:aspartate aminotransferase family protein [Bacillus sp. FJAT-42376]|uniref:aspartate aminotransferase family protein n=1 Tax=Bacillus sp. FJAT-42376 TaxID=2014076 RepID=UPI000F5018F9|nr:aspartate aminotransferase family protein [Bacillus sp. FJAT-42376]AZB43219.1 aspartate aminotransferase family protein [Bacillus sp. FJAT-42376]